MPDPSSSGISANMWPFILYMLVVIGLLVVTLAASWVVGSKARHGRGQDIPYESGILPVGDADDMRLSIEFYLVAIFFVIFDLETIFIVAWAVAHENVGWHGYIAIAIFIVILLIALLYEWRTGALDWGVKLRKTDPARYAVTEKS